MPSPKSKSSPKGKKSPDKSPKGKKGSPKSKETEEVEAPFVFVKPPPPPPPPDPPKGPLLSRLRRQLWYPYANRVSITHKEWFWSPCCPIITSWGDIWISEPQQRRILRYYFDPVSAKIIEKSPPLIVRGEPYVITEIPRTGRIAALVTCPKAKKTMLVLYDPVELKEEMKLDFRYEALPAPEPELDKNSKTSEPDEKPYYVLEDDCTPKGICANQDLLFVLFQPIQKLRIYDAVLMKEHRIRLENAYPDESACVHLATSGGCAASENQLFVAATRPARVQVFWIHRYSILGKIDRIDLTWYSELGLDRLSIGEPFGVQLDSLGLLVVSDSRAGFMRVYHTDSKRPPGPWMSSLPHGESSYLGSWKIDPYKNIRPGYFSLGKNGTACVVDRWANKMYVLADRTELRWYDETLLALDDAPFIRPILDPLMPVNGLPPPPTLGKEDGPLVRTVSDISLPIPDEELLPEKLVVRYKKKEEPVGEELGPKKSPDKKKSPKSKSPKSSKSKSPKSGSKKK